MNQGLPEFLQQGELARLIPVGSASQRERAACSVLLAALRVVHPLARDLLSEIGKRVGNRPAAQPALQVGKTVTSELALFETSRTFTDLTWINECCAAWKHD